MNLSLKYHAPIVNRSHETHNALFPVLMLSNFPDLSAHSAWATQMLSLLRLFPETAENYEQTLIKH